MNGDQLDSFVNRVIGDKDTHVTDEMLELILDEKRIGSRLKEAERKRRSLSTEQFYKLRARCKRDLFFFCKGILGYTRLSEVLHGDICTRIKQTEHTHRFREWLLPRMHFKSTVITIGYNLQIILPYTKEDQAHDDTSTPLAHPLAYGTDCRILIGHETSTGAERFLFAITNHVLSNPTLLALFPEIQPERRVHRINRSELELPRTRVYPEPTFDTMGVGAKSQGKHYNRINLDDVYGDKARDSDAEDETTKEWLDGIQSFLDMLAIDVIDFIGTRYKFDDAYGHIDERYGDKLYIYRRSVEEVGEDGIKRAIFPEEITEESLEILKKNPKNFAANYMNDPSQDGVGFDKDWKRYFEWKDGRTIRFDRRVGDSVRSELRNVNELNKVILIDPGERTGGLCVTGTDFEFRTFVLQALPIDYNPSILVELLFRLVVKWQPRVVAIESDSMQTVFQYWFRSEMQKRGIYFTVLPVYTKQKAKPQRIMGLAPFMSGEQFWMNKSQVDLIKEVDKFGRVTHKSIHILDALAYGPEVWSRGMLPGTYTDTISAQSTDWRDPSTGYTPIELIGAPY